MKLSLGALGVLALLALLGQATNPKTRDIVPSPSYNWSSCAMIPVVSTTCASVTSKSGSLWIGLKINGTNYLNVTTSDFSPTQVCVSQEELLQLANNTPGLKPYYPELQNLTKEYGSVPSDYFSVCLSLPMKQNTTSQILGCCTVDMTLMCGDKAPCVYQ